MFLEAAEKLPKITFSHVGRIGKNNWTKSRNDEGFLTYSVLYIVSITVRTDGENVIN